jgi:hypothetical protein
MTAMAEENKASLWDQIESRYWDSTRAVRAREDREAAEALRMRISAIEADLIGRYHERTRLRAELEKADACCREAEGQLRMVEEEEEIRARKMAKLRVQDDEEKRVWFLTYRRTDASEPDNVDDDDEAANDDAAGRVGLDEGAAAERLVRLHEAAMAARSHQAASPQPPPPMMTEGAKTGVQVYDGSGNFVGELRRINLSNHWVNTILRLPIKRHASIRPGRKFTTDSLQVVYEPTDTKGAKWLSFHIQATGEVQGQPCQTCTKNLGVFNECVIIGGEDFPRCGNCEWNRHGCTGAALHARPRSRRQSGSHAPVPSEMPSQHGGLRSPTTRRSFERLGPIAAAAGFTAVNNDAGPYASGERSPPLPKPVPGRKSLPTMKMSSIMNDDTPPPMHRRRKIDSEATTDADIDPEDDFPGPSLPEISKSSLVLKDDGVVFTEPPLMLNVPVGKISPDHPYWEADWKPIESEIQPILQKWIERHDGHVNNPQSSASSRFLANRQINRGKSILKYLRDGEVHPYQIVGKQWITKSLIGYDTLFRMVQILDELPKFNIDMLPSQWLRQRLHEIHLEKGASFDLSKTIHDLYHDPKVKAIRAKNGFGNIGRPSGYKMGNRGSPKQTPPKRPLKRKERPETPAQQLQMEAEQQLKEEEHQHRHLRQLPPLHQAHRRQFDSPEPMPRRLRPTSSSGSLSRPGTARQHDDTRPASPDSPQSTGSNKRARIGLASGENATATRRDVDVDDDEEDDGYTSTDSFSGDKVVSMDFRVCQVKTPNMTTSPTITQYWHFVDHAAPGGSADLIDAFEHQVLKDVYGSRATWGVYKEPYDFHLRLAELSEIAYSPDSEKVVIVTKPIDGVEHRGDLYAQFKRSRTKRRFLMFLKNRGIRVVQTSK